MSSPLDQHQPAAPRLLLADDEVDGRELLTILLEHHGYVVTAVGDGHMAVEAAANGEFDIAVLDIAMPRMNGLVAASHLRSRHPSIKIVFHTALDERFVQTQFEGYDAFFAKPLNLSKMLNGLSRLAVAEPAGS